MALPELEALDHALAAAVAAAAPSVVHVARGHGGGTGIAWGPDLVITASVHAPDRTWVGIGAADGAGELERRDAEVIGRDPGTDVALLRVDGGGLTPATFRELAGLAVGNLALALGRPGRSARASLRAIGVLVDRYVESDRPIPRGFAGGPLIDPDGAVVGMNTRTLIYGCDLAVPTVTLRRVVDELVHHGGIRKGYLGVGAYPSDRGALIASVEDRGPAAAAGMIVGDIVAEVEGRAVTGPDTLRAALASHPGATVVLAIVRGGAAQTLTVTLGSQP